MARLMGNPRITVTEKSSILPEWACLGTSVVLCHWLRAVHGKRGLGANTVMDPERQDLRLSVNYALMTRGLRGAFSSMLHLSLTPHRSASSHRSGEHLPLGSSYWEKVRRGVVVLCLAQKP